jgi:hypothetical protein
MAIWSTPNIPFPNCHKPKIDPQESIHLTLRDFPQGLRVAHTESTLAQALQTSGLNSFRSSTDERTGEGSDTDEPKQDRASDQVLARSKLPLRSKSYCTRRVL